MQVQGYVKTTHSVVLDYAVDVHVLNDEDLQLSYGELGNFRLLVAYSHLFFLNSLWTDCREVEKYDNNSNENFPDDSLSTVEELY